MDLTTKTVLREQNISQICTLNTGKRSKKDLPASIENNADVNAPGPNAYKKITSKEIEMTVPDCQKK